MQHNDVYFDGEYWRCRRLPRSCGRKRVPGKFDTEKQAQEARQQVIKKIECNLPEIPENVNLIEIKPLTLDYDRWLYASDFHAPLHNREYVKRLMFVAKKRNVEHLIIGGDYFDFQSSSSHPKTETQASLNQTLRIGGDLLVSLCGVFNTIAILPGNHCLRVAKKLDEPLGFDMLVHAALRGRCTAQITTTDYDYCYVKDNWVVGHPRFFENSSTGLIKVAMRERRNVIGAHNHAINLSYTPDGQYLAIYPGHMSDATLTPYIMQSKGLSRFPEWKNGFVMVDSGVTVFGDGLTDWKSF